MASPRDYFNNPMKDLIDDACNELDAAPVIQTDEGVTVFQSEQNRKTEIKDDDEQDDNPNARLVTLLYIFLGVAALYVLVTYVL